MLSRLNLNTLSPKAPLSSAYGFPAVRRALHVCSWDLSRGGSDAQLSVPSAAAGSAAAVAAVLLPALLITKQQAVF